MEAWAAENGVTYGHLYMVIGQGRRSVSLNAKIDAFIAEHLPPTTPVISETSAIAS